MTTMNADLTRYYNPDEWKQFEDMVDLKTFLIHMDKEQRKNRKQFFDEFLKTHTSFQRLDGKDENAIRVYYRNKDLKLHEIYDLMEAYGHPLDIWLHIKEDERLEHFLNTYSKNNDLFDKLIMYANIREISTQLIAERTGYATSMIRKIMTRREDLSAIHGENLLISSTVIPFVKDLSMDECSLSFLAKMNEEDWQAFEEYKKTTGGCKYIDHFTKQCVNSLKRSKSRKSNKKAMAQIRGEGGNI